MTAITTLYAGPIDAPKPKRIARVFVHDAAIAIVGCLFSPRSVVSIGRLTRLDIETVAASMPPLVASGTVMVYEGENGCKMYGQVVTVDFHNNLHRSVPCQTEQLTLI